MANKKSIFLAGILTIFISAAAQGGEEAQNPVKQEMIALRTAFVALVDALLLNKLDAVEPAFHEVHKAREATEKAIEEGKVKLPQNQKRFKEFVKMDEEFHKEIETLLGAVNKNDANKIKQTTHRMLNACIACHRIFK
ncbi:MAG: cytochrome c [Deltaproteobacteria bacterium]|nr:cytochrome c [Deltaproteobacteria bacterium]